MVKSNITGVLEGEEILTQTYRTQGENGGPRSAVSEEINCAHTSRNVRKYIFFPFFFFFGLFRAAPVAYGGSQARGPIGAVAAGLHHSHSNSGSELHL